MVANQNEGFVFRQRHPHRIQLSWNFCPQESDANSLSHQLEALTLHIAPIGSGEPRSQFSMPTTKLGDKKYYLGIFFKVSKHIAPWDFVGWSWFQLWGYLCVVVVVSILRCSRSAVFSVISIFIIFTLLFQICSVTRACQKVNCFALPKVNW